MLVSVIIPVFNCKKYIRRCLESVLIQSYKDIEIVIIDDGSTDDSNEIISEYKDNRIKLYRKENGGVSSARNFGITKSTGEFILFVDADDYIDKNMILILINEVKNIDSSFVMCNNFEMFMDRTEERVIFEDDKMDLTNEDAIRVIANGKAGLVCSKLVSRKVLEENEILFDTNLIVSEDQVFFAKVAEKCSEIKYIKKSLYFYDRRNEDSATIKHQEGLIINFEKLHNEMEVIFKRNNLCLKEDKELLGNKIFVSATYCLFNEVRVVRKVGIKNTIKNIREIVDSINSMKNFKYVGEKSFIYERMRKSIIRNTSLSSWELLMIGKLLVMKNG